jgi:hypothetical protein
MTRSEDELKALVKRAVKARTDHPSQHSWDNESGNIYTWESSDHTLQMRVSDHPHHLHSQ